ncbi:unnamed protein product [Mytilus edulis]|uniref:Uncharacterized protein n=1 Tax=Mytilus edulis TaxID=6550 RepID=A0A8S3PQZ5_MYTED|nr:unnamed protein product [Mytilus edulis]
MLARRRTGEKLPPLVIGKTNTPDVLKILTLTMCLSFDNPVKMRNTYVNLLMSCVNEIYNSVYFVGKKYVFPFIHMTATDARRNVLAHLGIAYFAKTKECLTTIEGLDYTGTVNSTRSGFSCREWARVALNMTENTKQLLGDSHNYCRNPDNDRYGPWCYTYDHEPDAEQWGYCGIPFCGSQNWKHGWQKYEDSCYIIQYTLQTWDEAKNLCQDNQNAYLAEIKTARENSFLMNILPKPNIDTTGLAGEVWLGANALNAKRQFIWNTSSTYLDFTDWGPGEPNGRYYEHCLSTHMYNDSKLHWNDRACSTKHFFVSAVTTTYAEVREAARQIMQGPVSACTYNTLVYRFTDKDGHTHDGYDDDRDYGIGSRILDYLKEIDAHNITIISSRTPPSGTAKIGSRKNNIILEGVKSVLRKISVTKTSIVPSIKSDHSLIKLTLSGENFSERGPGFWKFNSGLLTDKDYVDIVKNTLSECDDKYQNLENKNLKWDTIKSEIRGATVKYSKYKNMKLRERESNLKKRQDEIHKNLSRTYLDKDINTLLIELDVVKDDLEQIVNNQTRGAIIRSHAEHCEGNERNSKYFLSLEKRNYKNKCINKLVVNDIEILSQEKILNEERNFYENLYSSKEDPDKYSGDSNFFDLNFIPKLTDLEKDICDADISESECVKTRIEENGRCVRRKSPINKRGPLPSMSTTSPLQLMWMDFLSLEPSKGGYQHY